MASGASAIDLGLACGESLPPDIFAGVRRRVIFEACKWDPQVEDVPILAPFPLVIEESQWRELAECAERLAAEMYTAEAGIRARPDLWEPLAMDRTMRRALRRALRDAPPPAAAAIGSLPRVVRFDFHPTPQGWVISEANSDVPGGFIESGAFTRLVGEHFADLVSCGDPGESLARAVARVVMRDRSAGRRVALVHATAYSDDRQVMIYLERKLASLGLETVLLAPDQLQWAAGRAASNCDWNRGPLDCIVRFFPGEWLPNLPRRSGWPSFFANTVTPVVNPATALLTQSKRFPLVWDALETPMPTWRRLLPETVDPRRVPWRDDPHWVLKPAFGRVGDFIGLQGVTDQKTWKTICRAVRRYPKYWVAQRRFETLPIATPDGDAFACLGVYVIDGRAAGCYGRIAMKPLVNHVARDVAVLVRTRDSEQRPIPTPAQQRSNPAHIASQILQMEYAKAGNHD